MHPLRARFDDDIIAEVQPPRGVSRRVIVLCNGMPSTPGKHRLMQFFSHKGFWVIEPRYRGTWESGGRFLARSPHEDIRAVISALKKSFVAFNMEERFEYDINPEQVIVVGTSFGGAAALLLSLDSNVHKVVALAPVVDWRSFPQESFAAEYAFVTEGFNAAYRFDTLDVERIRKGEMYNPISIVDKASGSDIMIIHAEDDEVVPVTQSKDFAAACQARLYTPRHGGHVSASLLMRYVWYYRFKKFISN